MPDSSLDVLSREPLNAGVPIGRLDGRHFPQGEMYVRENFSRPAEPPTSIALTIPGRPDAVLDLDVLAQHQRVEASMVLECAGNGRSLMRPVPEGTAWGLTGASPVAVRGVLLADVLGSLPDDVVSVVFTGADRGEVDPEGTINYQFALDRQLALSPAPLLVTHVGDDPLELAHGGPVRLMVRGHYGMKSVKWLTRIEASEEPFDGHFDRKYRYFRDEIEPEGSAVGEIRLRSVISSPHDGDLVGAGSVSVTGSAWSGAGIITAVEVTTDGGASWTRSDLTAPSDPYDVTAWATTVELRPGPVEILARATDASGASQPMTPRWNANGYANNVCHRVSVHVT